MSLFKDFFVKKVAFFLGITFFAFVPLKGLEFELESPRKVQEKDVQYGLGTFDKKREDIRISPYYRSGSFLIYDCKDGHFACVIQENFDDCKKLREKAKLLGSSNLVCAPLKKFKDRTECRKVHYKKLYQKSSDKICKVK